MSSVVFKVLFLRSLLLLNPHSLIDLFTTKSIDYLFASPKHVSLIGCKLVSTLDISLCGWSNVLIVFYFFGFHVGEGRLKDS